MTDTGNVFSKWNQSLGDLLPHFSSPNLPGRMQRAISSVIPFEHMMIFGYRPKGRPLDFYNAGDSEYRKVIVQAYIAGGYLLDPFYRTYLGGVEPRIYCLNEVAPDGFRESEYNLTHFAHTGIYDEVVIYIGIDQGLTAAVSLTRNKNHVHFSTQEIAMLNDMLPVITAIVRHYWIGGDHPEETGGDVRTLASLQSHIQNAFSQFGRAVLTNRECEVIGLILSGYSTNAIGSYLSISSGTVKIHRKNAYQKLEISSQSELFSMFLTSLSDPSLWPQLND